MSKHDITPVILSGGSGTRLWPISRADSPKQLQRLVADHSLLQSTLLRGQGDAFSAPLLVANAQHLHLVADQLAHIGVAPSAIILEPEGRNTAPAVALAAEHLVQAGAADTLMLVMPSDHLIADMAAFHAAIASATPAALAGRLVTFGITPAGPATGYGYIDPGESDGPVRAVRRFVEKPNRETAVGYVADGWLWNAGIFLFRPDVFLQALRRYASEVAEAVSRTYAASRQADGIVHIDAAEFAQSPSISVDHAVMEQADTVSVIAVSMGWSDVGSWDALWEVSAADADGNRLDGNVAAIDCANSLVRSDGGPFVAALGLRDMVVVATGNAILVAPRSRSEEVKQVVAAIEARGLDLARTSHEVRRPWGSYRCLTGAEGWQTKRITVRAGGQLSLQKHAWRAETWVVASGRAIVTVDAETMELEPGESVHIPAGAVHRLENPGPQVLELLEVQLGSYLGEDDIVRLADAYGRVPAA